MPHQPEPKGRRSHQTLVKFGEAWMSSATQIDSHPIQLIISKTSHSQAANHQELHTKTQFSKPVY